MGKNSKRSRCPKCNSLNVIKWGIQCGCQRFKCKDCGTCFTPTRPDVSASNRFVWFRKWVSGKQRIEDIAKESGYSSRQLHRWFDEYLKDAPECKIQHRKAYTHLDRAVSNMFKYIDNPDVPKNTNSLESFFGHLKDNLRIHRGLSHDRLNDFIKWYLYFSDEKKKKD